MTNFYLYAFIFVSLLFSGCTAEDISMDDSGPHLRKDSLRLLCIGSSYSLDGTIFLPQLMEDNGIHTNTYGIYCAMYAGASLDYWHDIYTNDKEIEYLYRMGGRMLLPERKWTLKELLHEHWDVVVLQQSSNLSGNYSSYEPYLKEMVDAVRKESSNKHVVLAWHLLWSHDESFYKGPYEYYGWRSIAETTRIVQNDYGFDFIIPAGTAIQNARNSALNDELQLTRDGSHIANGMGHYILGMTWFETFCKPVYGKSCLVRKPSETLRNIDTVKDTYYPITDQNYPLAQKCVEEALRQPFEIMKQP